MDVLVAAPPDIPVYFNLISNLVVESPPCLLHTPFLHLVTIGYKISKTSLYLYWPVWAVLVAGRREGGADAAASSDQSCATASGDSPRLMLPTMVMVRNDCKGIGGTSEAVPRTTADASRRASLEVEVNVNVKQGHGHGETTANHPTEGRRSAAVVATRMATAD